MSRPPMNTCVFSADETYRYTLQARWDELPLVQFIGLNPSTADDNADDPTIRRCKAFAKSIGAGGMVMTNLFAFRCTNPDGLKTAAHPIGESGQFIGRSGCKYYNRNDLYLCETAATCEWRIACWGTKGTHLYRNVKVKLLIPNLLCLRLTKGGHPEHPLYLKSDLRPVPFT